MLFDVFIFIWPIWNYIKRKRLGCVIAGVFWCVGILGIRLFPNVFSIWTACQYVPFFYFGIQICLDHTNSKKSLVEQIPWWIWLGLDLVLFVLNKVVTTKIAIPGVEILTTFLLHIIGALMAIAILQKIAQSINWKKSRVLNILSKYSMPMYLFHQQIIYFVIIWLNGKVNPFVNAGVNFLIAIAISLVISWALMRFRITRFLVGEK